MVLERDRYVSFANCGLPYHIGGAIPDRAACCRRRRAPETHASLTLQVNSPRWAGVPFTLRSGKALGGGLSRDRHPLPPPARYLLDQWPGVEPNVLESGADRAPRAAVHHAQRPRAHSRDSAARGALDTATVHRLRPPDPRHAQQQPDAVHPRRRSRRGLAHHLIRGDEAEEAWRIIDPVTKAWTAGDVPMSNTQPAKRTMRSGLRKGRSPGSTR